MPNLRTHKSLKAQGIYSVAGNPGFASSTTDTFFSFNNSEAEFRQPFFSGTDEFSVGDTMTSSGGQTAKVTGVVIESGAWATNNATGYLEIKKLTDVVALLETLTSNTGGAATAGPTAARGFDSSLNDCTFFHGITDVNGSLNVPKFDTTEINPTNPLQWNEDAVSVLDDVLFVCIAAHNIATWVMSYGDVATILGGIKIDRPSNAVKVVGASGNINMTSVSGLLTDDLPHTYAVLLRRTLATTVVSVEVDGIEIATDSGTIGQVQCTAENALIFNASKMYASGLFRFKSGIPSDYKLAIAEMAVSAIAGEPGISSRFIGTR